MIEVLAYMVLFCFEYLRGPYHQDVFVAPPPPVMHYELHLSPHPVKIPEDIDWERVEHED